MDFGCTHAAPATAQHGSFVLEQRLALSVSILIYFVYAHFLIPTRDCEVIGDGTETNVGYAVFWRARNLDVFRQVALGGIGRSCSRRLSTEERHVDATSY